MTNESQGKKLIFHYSTIAECPVLKLKISDVSAGVSFPHIAYICNTMHGVILGIRLGIQLHKYPVSVQVTSLQLIC